MNWNRIFYAIHRWVSLIAIVQLVVWVGTGLVFTLLPIKRVRGLHEETSHVLTPNDGAALISASTAISLAGLAGMPNVESLELRNSWLVDVGPVYVLRGPHHSAMRLAARSGARIDVAQNEAEEIARRDQAGTPAVRVARLIEREDDAPVEYRDKPLPAWRVELDDLNDRDLNDRDRDVGMVIWVDARTGDITARRSDLWRTYDFLWSLHIMDYRGHEQFNHPLLSAAAIVAACALLSGLTLWIVRLRRRLALNKA